MHRKRGVAKPFSYSQEEKPKRWASGPMLGVGIDYRHHIIPPAQERGHAGRLVGGIERTVV